MSITINYRAICLETKNINTLKLEEIEYDNEIYIFINLNDYKNIDVVCDGYEKIYIQYK